MQFLPLLKNQDSKKSLINDLVVLYLNKPLSMMDFPAVAAGTR